MNITDHTKIMVGSRVYVGGLPYGVRERDLERFFKGYGRTRDILIKNGYGFVVSYTLASLSYHVFFLYLYICVVRHLHIGQMVRLQMLTHPLYCAAININVWHFVIVS